MIALLIAIGLFGGVIGNAIPEIADTGKTPFALEDVLSRGSKGFKFSWKSGNEIVYQNSTTKDLMVYDFNRKWVLAEASVLKKYNAGSYYLSPDGEHLLLGHTKKKIFRHSSTEKYVIYSLADKKYTELAGNADLHLAMWAPNSRIIIYVKDNNIYYADVDNGEVEPITKNGVPGLLFNGVADWVYEEEILGTGNCIRTSPNGQQLVYISINEENVTENVFMEYGKPGNAGYQYAREVRIRYPKTGTSIPTYKFARFNFGDKSTEIVSEYRNGREFLYDYSWVTDSLLAVCYSNRVQNVTEVDLCDIRSGKCTLVAEDKNPRGWSILAIPVFSRTGERYLWRKRQPVGREEYYHLHLVKTDGSEEIALTNGTFMVRDIVEWDEANGVVYYRASEVGKPSSDHVYAVSETGRESPVCVTCQLTSPDGIPCRTGSVFFSADRKRAIGYCSGPSAPFYSSYEYSADKKLKLLEFLESNTELRSYMETKLQPRVVDVRVNVAKNIEAEARLYLPPNADVTGKTKYPMIVYVYGGPDNPQVTDQFRFDWSLYLTTNRSVIYCVIDGRGTGRKGTEMMYAMYRSFGTVEIQDQINVVKYLHEKYRFIDGNRTGIWGWSYGGYSTTKVLENDADGSFRCGVAGAPVTDWMYYNSAYTERYMSLPSDNPIGYKEASALHNVENLRKKKYLLIHGTGDDNVHYQNAMALAKVLEDGNIMFEQASYPDEDHGFVGTSKIHMMHTMNKFFEECFDLSH